MVAAMAAMRAETMGESKAGSMDGMTVEETASYWVVRKVEHLVAKMVVQKAALKVDWWVVWTVSKKVVRKDSPMAAD